MAGLDMNLGIAAIVTLLILKEVFTFLKSRQNQDPLGKLMGVLERIAERLTQNEKDHSRIDNKIDRMIDHLIDR